MRREGVRVWTAMVVFTQIDGLLISYLTNNSLDRMFCHIDKETNEYWLNIEIVISDYWYLNSNRCHDANFVVTGGARSCHDNLRYYDNNKVGIMAIIAFICMYVWCRF